jgi:hypothetical protein
VNPDSPFGGANGDYDGSTTGSHRMANEREMLFGLLAQRDVSISYEKLALVLKEQKRYGDAIKYAEKALGVSRKLVEAAENDASA